MTAIDKDRTYIYVASGHYGLHSKIGVSGNPNQRVNFLRQSYDCTVELEYAVYCSLNEALRTERCAHGLLKEFALGQEWFRVENDIAITTVNQAISLVSTGEYDAGKRWSRCNLASRVPPQKIKYRLTRRGECVPTFEQIVSTQTL